MKHHIIVKFVAVLLCAASLLGVVGCGLGIFALTEMDLYDKTVEQIYEERIRSDAYAMAHDRVLAMAGHFFGGCPEPMLRQMYPRAEGQGNLNPLYYSYELKDKEGNVLNSGGQLSGGSYKTYTFDITGQYMHLVDTITASKQAEETARDTLEDGALLVDAIPAEGAAVYEFQITTVSSSVGASGYSGAIVFRNQDGQVIFRDPGLSVDPIMENEVVTAITLFGIDGEVLYEAAWHSGIGTLRFEPDGGVTFFSYSNVEPAAAEPAEEPVPTVIAPEETVPAETVAEVTEAVEVAENPTEATVAEEAAEDASAEDAAEGEDGEETAEEEQETISEEYSEEEEYTEETAEVSSDTEADTDAEAAVYEEDSEVESAAEDDAEVTEETAAPTVPETVPETIPEETVPAETIPEPVMINGKPLNSYQINRTEYYDDASGEWTTARYVYLPMSEVTLEFHAAPGVLYGEASYVLMWHLRNIRGYLLPMLGICLLILAACVVYLCCAAGRNPKSDEVRPGGLNRLPLDLYGFAAIAGVVGVGLVISEGGEYMLQQNVMIGCAFMAGLGYLACLLVVGFFFACVAQFKTPGGFWWYHSLFGLGVKLCLWLVKKFCRLCVRLEEWASSKGWPLVKRLLAWIRSRIRSFFRWVYGQLNRFLSLLPVTWQWILAGAVMVLFLFVTVAGRYDVGIVLAILFAFGLVFYGAHCFGTLMDTTRKMNKGNLDCKVDDKLMTGAFKDFAGDLNDLAGVASVAAQKQLKSERMKTELITNVSHDIRTPLTSIINYVDLLQKPHTEEEQAQYLEVLDRQSQRLKKLIDDLIDMSKASTGNMAVDVTLVDAVESVNQALGEFSDKLDRARLIPVFRHSDDTVAMMADGRLVWRVLSNLLGNAVKYAMPGTRLYIDLMTLDGKVVISLKNISREELNVDAEELMERFVRGDGSRNTEGSGLGLNIAKSLMELQKGQLELLVDGDLFKVTLIFPGI